MQVNITLIVGVGLPDALHFNVMFEPSRTITSLELNESSMLGGTVKYNKINWKKMNLKLKRKWNKITVGEKWGEKLEKKEKKKNCK